MAYVYNRITVSAGQPRCYDGMQLGWAGYSTPAPAVNVPQAVNVDGMTDFQYFFYNNKSLTVCPAFVGSYQIQYAVGMFDGVVFTSIPFELDLSACQDAFTLRSATVTSASFKQGSVSSSIFAVAPLDQDSMMSLINALVHTGTAHTLHLLSSAEYAFMHNTYCKVVGGLCVICPSTDPDVVGTLNDYVINVIGFSISYETV